jgi:ElaB/YqjD/DUF883 family membrane-anchored ribosome-binding protein
MTEERKHRDVVGFESSDVPLKQPGESSVGTAERAQESAKEKTRQWKEQAREKLNRKSGEQTSRVAQELVSAAEALRETSHALKEKNKEQLSLYAEKAADQTEHLSNFLREKDMEQLMKGAEDFARRRPWVAIGGAFVAGTLLARFLKS